MTFIHSQLGKAHAQHMRKMRKMRLVPKPVTDAEKVAKQIRALRVRHDKIPVRANMTAAQLSKNVDLKMSLRSQMRALMLSEGGAL